MRCGVAADRGAGGPQQSWRAAEICLGAFRCAGRCRTGQTHSTGGRCDDTGSTAAACALALKRAGAARVALLTVARVDRRMEASAPTVGLNSTGGDI